MMRPPRRLFFLPWLVMVISLGLTWLAWAHELKVTNEELQSQFDFSLRETISKIDQRVATYEQTLRGLQGLLATTDMSNRQAIGDYVQTLQLDANFSGIKILGVIQQIQPAEKAAHVATMRALGLTDYTVHPQGDNAIYAPVIQREPEFTAYETPLGLDHWTDPVRRHAMETARDSGMPALSGKVRLAVDKGREPNPGFIMYLPVFARGKPHDSLTERHRHLVGWVYASFLMRDFMASLYGSQPVDLVIDIYDDANPTEEALMYRSGEPAGGGQTSDDSLTAVEYMVIAGHTWTLMLRTLESFQGRMGGNISRMIIVTGVSLSMLLSILVWFMIAGRSRALQLAGEMTEELRHMAQHDPLTHLPNRALLSDRVQYELARTQRNAGHFAMIFLDLDNFKPINDNYGHAIGDKVLRDVARRLRETVRASDTVGRIGGDEFVVLMPDVPTAGAALGLAEKIRQTVRQPYHVNDVSLALSCSLGVAVYPEDGSDEVSLTKAADEAMYRAKELGRDSVQAAARGDGL